MNEELLFVITDALGVAADDVTDIRILKKGMTNRSFLFTCKGKKYILRIPGEGTGRMINRMEETAVYQAIGKFDICDKIIYIDPHNGCKITGFWENTRVCNPLSMRDIKLCMRRLRSFHELELKVDHEFDLYGQIEFYESLRGGIPSRYDDYEETKMRVLSLRPFIDAHVQKRVLAHIDAVSDNFLFVEEQGEESVRLIDWEYAGMQDPHVDIAMFCIYALYNRTQVDKLIDLYFTEGCTKEIRIKIYCYISVCGLLWSNWCEYKRSLGVEFGDYAVGQYSFAVEYYGIVQAELKEMDWAKDV